MLGGMEACHEADGARGWLGMLDLTTQRYALGMAGRIQQGYGQAF
jgi:hypothetical protein